VRHHVLLSIVGISRTEGGTAHYAGKREQERLIDGRQCTAARRERPHRPDDL
jgi:hypothetical protein